jgi:hypothetical protein
MSCSWENDYTTNSRQFDVSGEVCDKNLPAIAAIPLHGEEKRILMQLPKKMLSEQAPSNSESGSIGTHEKFSFIALPELRHRLHKMENVLWSDTWERSVE